MTLAHPLPEWAGAEADRRFMDLAFSIGRRGAGQTWPNPSVGAVVVRFGGAEPIVVGRGWTQPGGRPHAEVEALRHAGEAARGATLYVTLEPCSHHGRTPPCADALVAAGVARVVSAMDDPNPEVAGAGHARLRAAGIAVEVGLGAAEARRAHDGHIRRMAAGRPHVTLKLAVSADGKVALAGRRPVAITGETARARVHMLRAMNDAILIGAGTALADDPELTCRLPGMESRSPVRVVLDSRARLPVSGRLATSARQTPVWLMTGEAALSGAQALQARGVDLIAAPVASGRIEPAAALKLLAGRGITRVLLEGGPQVAAAFLNDDLVDEVVLLRGPGTIGPDGIDALDGLPLSALTASPRLVSRGIETLGPDTVEMFERAEAQCLPGS